MSVPFQSVCLSLADLLGREYVAAVSAAASALSGRPAAELRRVGAKRIDLYPASFHRRILALLPRVGEFCGRPLSGSARGATSAGFEEKSSSVTAPVSALGLFRVGEDGRLRFISKAEHYHVLLGHGFPGYRLLEHARALGIPNATHNNTRGHITRLLEEDLVRTANGIPRGDRRRLDRALASGSLSVMNRVLNLQSGSLAAEAAIKLVLARFHRAQSDTARPVQSGRIPVLLVVGNDDGGLEANYHGTTFLAQAMRGMWPGMLEACERQGVFKVRAVRANDIAGLDAAFARWHRGRHRVAGFFHEIVMMNYGARRMTKAFLKRAYALCRRHDVPTVADEIQSCGWSPQTYMFREYGLRPAVAVVGKGFSGGEYAASRVILSSAIDNLPQFGALVTNGQEELSSLAYLVTLRWVEANADAIRQVGEQYHSALKSLAVHHRRAVAGIEGVRHLSAVVFRDLEVAQVFARRLNAAGLDISVQSYKADCPPAALTKIPVTADATVMQFVVARMEDALKGL